MSIIVTFLLVVFTIVAVLIIILVMLQDEQGEGFGGLFGGGGGSPFGTTGGSVLVKATATLGVFFMVISLALAMSYKSGESDNVISESRQSSGTGQDWFLDEPQDPVE